MEPLLEIKDLCIAVAPKPGQAPEGKLVSQVSLALQSRERLTLIGETGSGKSLIAHAVLGLLPPEMEATGRIAYRGQDLLSLSRPQRRALWGREIFLFPQEPSSALNPTMRALRQVSETLRWALGRTMLQAEREAAALLEKVGLEPVPAGRRYPFQLSGGMRQRLLTAITLSQPARLIIADEPTKGLDRRRRDLVIELLKGLSAQGKTVITITHDLEAARLLGGSMAVLYGGCVMELGRASQVLERPGHPYTRALLAALPENGLHPIPLAPGSMPSGKGCVFVSRCAQVLAICRRQAPAWLGYGPEAFLRCHHKPASPVRSHSSSSGHGYEAESAPLAAQAWALNGRV